LAEIFRFTRLRERKKVRRWTPGWQTRRRWRSSVSWILGALVLLAFLGLASAEWAFRAAGCTIKGNIGQYGGERIFHAPGQEFYAATRIDLWKGERWFCSEEAARKAGWRRARV